jgi:oligo-1,6-glucosidase
VEFLQEMQQEVLRNYDVFTVGEMPGVTTEHAIDITHVETGHLNMLFQFEHMGLDSVEGSSKWNHKPWDLLDLKRVMTSWQKELEGTGWNSLYLSNHDQSRAVSRFGHDGHYHVQSAKLLATFLHLLHGTPYVYQGEEIGMTNVRFPSIEDYRDIETLNMYHEAVEEKGIDPQLVMEMIYAKSRDNARTPMQWNGGAHAGFTIGTPWMKVNPNYLHINVEQAVADPDGIFHYYQQLIRLRKANPVIVYGTYDLLIDAHEQIYAFTRTLGDDRLLVILNFSKDMPVFALPTYVAFSNTELLISNYGVDLNEDIRLLTLRPWEARVYRLW